MFTVMDIGPSQNLRDARDNRLTVTLRNCGVYSSSKITTTQIQISRQDLNGFFWKKNFIYFF